MNEARSPIAVRTDDPLIIDIRGQRVVVDADLASLYGTSTKKLNQAVKRNRLRFPHDFMFQLTAIEKDEVVTMCDHLSKLKFAPTLPYAFTEHGVVMAASVLNSPRAVEASVFVVRAFVRLRHLAASHKDLAKKLDELERKVGGHDEAIKQLVTAIRQLMTLPPSEKNPRRIGFRTE
jgi:hypothetical protein